MANALVVPVLDAGPYILRPFAESDFDVVVEASEDPYIPLITTVPTTPDVSSATAFLHRQWDRAASGLGYSWAVAERQANRAVGQAGLWPKAEDPERASVGYWVAASERGQGAAGHALAAVTRWGLDELHLERVELYIEPSNEASIRTAERAGFLREGLLRSWQRIGGARRDLWMYARLASDPGPSVRADMP